jgi:hypothetical protein
MIKQVLPSMFKKSQIVTPFSVTWAGLNLLKNSNYLHPPSEGKSFKIRM